MIEYQVPGPSIIPLVQEYRYVKNRDVIEEKLRKEFDERRRPLVTAMEETLKAEFSKPVSADKPAESK